eukprot:GHVL01019953.1.p1 GENE.GHVL01019953.1~~GHVL01019953.1.p1  ORF type:complete len:188 (-),score=34.62 GHVL01019953.1:162-725(-)
MRTFSLFFVYFCLLKNITSWRQSALKAQWNDPTEETLENLRFTFSSFFSKKKGSTKYDKEWNEFISRIKMLKDAVEAKNKKSIWKEAQALIADKSVDEKTHFVQQVGYKVEDAINNAMHYQKEGKNFFEATYFRPLGEIVIELQAQFVIDDYTKANEKGIWECKQYKNLVTEIRNSLKIEGSSQGDT